MTTSIFSKLSQQSKHRDLLENQDPDAPPIGNLRTGKTIAEFRAMGLDVRMVCGSCRTNGPLDLSALPKGADTESRLIAARCPSCGSDAVSQEVVALGSVVGPAFVAFVRVPRVASSKSSYRSKPARADLLSTDDILPDLLPILNKEIAEAPDLSDGLDAQETEDAETKSARLVAPVKTSAKTAAKPAAPTISAAKAAPAKSYSKAPAKKIPSKPSGKAVPKAPAQTVSGKAPTKPSTKVAAKTTSRPASAKAPTKTPSKPSSKAVAKSPVQAASAKAPTKVSAKAAAKTTARPASAKAPAKACKTTAQSGPSKTPAKIIRKVAPAPKISARSTAISVAKMSGKAGAKTTAKPAEKAAPKTPVKKEARR